MKRVDTEKFKVSIVNATLDCSSFEVGENAVVTADFAYELEREVDRLKEEVRALREVEEMNDSHIEYLNDEIKRLKDNRIMLDSERNVLRISLAKANASVGDAVEAERNRIIAASDAAFRYINRHNK